MYQGEVTVTQECLASFLKTAELLQISGLAGTNAVQPGSDPSTSPPRAPPDPLSNPPDSPGTVISKINSDLSFTKQKRNEKEKEAVQKITAIESDPEQSCSYTTASNLFIKTESMERDYDDMEADPAELKGTTNEQYDTTAHGDEPSILERSLKAQSGKFYIIQFCLLSSLLCRLKEKYIINASEISKWLFFLLKCSIKV